MGAAASPESSNNYVAALKRSGAADESVVSILRNAGWPEKDAVAALAAHYETLTGLAPPTRARSLGGPREAFLHLLAFITLSVSCIAAGSLWFTLIDLWFPDPAAPRFVDPLAGMAWNLAALLVTFPVLLLVVRTVWRELVSRPEQADSGVRRWLTYVAMLVAAASVIGDLIVFVEHLLRGGMSARFAAKAGGVGRWRGAFSTSFSVRFNRAGRPATRACVGSEILALQPPAGSSY